MDGFSLNRTLEKLSWWIIVALAMGAPLLIGSVHGPTKLLWVFLSGALLVIHVLHGFRKGYRIRLDGFMLMGLGLMGLMVFQILPLGRDLMEWLSPAGLKLLDSTRALGFDVPNRLSLSPSETLDSLVMLGAAFSIYLVVFNQSYRDGNGARFLSVVGASAAVVAAVTLAQSLGGAKGFLGFFVPSFGMPPEGTFFSTFVNPNHAAAYLNLGFFLLVGHWRRSQFGGAKGLAGTFALVSVLASVALLSRGGFLSLLVGLATLLAFARWTGAVNQTPSASTSSTIMGVLLSLVTATVFLAAFNLLLSQTQNIQFLAAGQDEPKLDLWRHAVNLLRPYALAGAGVSAFGAAMSPLNDFFPSGVFLFAENEPLQSTIEIGLPLTILALLIILVLFWRRATTNKTTHHFREAICGLVALGVHNLVDYNIRVPGILIPVAIVMGAMSGAFARNFTRRRRWRVKMTTIKALPLAVVFFFLLISGGIRAMDISRDSAYAALEALPTASIPAATQRSKAIVNEIVELYPLDSHVFCLLGNWASRSGDNPRAEVLYQHSLTLLPAAPAPKIGLATLQLRQKNYEAALGWMRKVAEDLPLNRGPLLESLYRSQIDPETVVASWGTNDELLLQYVDYLKSIGRPDEVERVVLASMKNLGLEADLLSRLGFLYLAQEQVTRADLIATYLMALFPERQEGYLIQARVYVRLNRLDDALLMYEEARRFSRGDDNVAISLETLGLLARVRQWDRFEALSGEIRSLVLKESHFRAFFHQIIATREEMRGKLFAALSELDQAEMATPLDVRIPLRKASIQLKLGRVDKASAEYRKALKINPADRTAADGLRDLEPRSEAIP